MGRLIPAGTGLAHHQNLGIRIEAPEGWQEESEAPGGLIETSSADAPVPPPRPLPPFPEDFDEDRPLGELPG